MMRLAMMESCFTGSRQEAFALAAQVGAEGLEPVIHDRRGLKEFTDPARLAGVRQAAEQAKLAVSSIALVANCQTDGLVRLSDSTPVALEMARSAVKAAAELGCGVVLLPFFGQASIELESELEFACLRLSELGEAAEDAGVVIGVESMLSRDQKLYLSDHTGGLGVRHYYDVANVASRHQDPATELRDLGAARICGVHFKDVRLREAQPAEWNVGLGQGQVDFVGVAQALKAIGYDGWITLETPPLDDPLGNAKINMAFARKVLGL